MEIIIKNNLNFDLQESSLLKISILFQLSPSGTTTKTKVDPDLAPIRKSSSDRLFYILALVAVVVANIIVQVKFKGDVFSGPTEEIQVDDDRPTFYLHGKNIDGGHLKHVIAVLQRLGLKRTLDLNGTWDLMWAHDYPFGELKNMM